MKHSGKSGKSAKPAKSGKPAASAKPAKPPAAKAATKPATSGTGSKAANGVQAARSAKQARTASAAKAAKAAKRGKAAPATKHVQDSEVEAVAELVSLVACPRSAVNELALACENTLDSMDMAAGFARFTSAAWSERPGEFGVLDAISRDLVEALERQANTIGAILDRLAPLAGDPDGEEEDDHSDLDPAEVLARLRPLLSQSRDAAIGA